MGRRSKKCSCQDRKCCHDHKKSCKKIRPDQPGPCDVGFCEADVELVNGTAKVLIWYPVKQGYCPRWKQDNIDASNTYKTFSTGFFSFFEPSIPFEFPSVLKAVKNAQIKRGCFPLTILTIGGGNADATDPQKAFAYARTGEHLASYGIVTIGYTRLVRGIDGAADVSALIDYMETTFKFASSVDTSKTIALGNSAGSQAAMGVSGAWVDQADRDPRVKGLILTEGFKAQDLAGTFLDLKVPSLYFGRDVAPIIPDTYNYNFTMDVAVQSNPRYYVNVEGSSHLAQETSRLDMINGSRDVSLSSGTTTDPLIVPPGTDHDPDGFSYMLSLDPNGRFAFIYWNLAQFLFGPPDFPVEGLNTIPNKIVGVGNNIINTDADNDGFVDTPKYITETATGGGPSTIDLASTFTSVNNFPISQAQYDTAGHLDGFAINIVSGTGVDQGRTITAWAGSPSYTATVDSPWTVEPDATSVYIVSDQQGPLQRAINGTFFNGGYLGFDEQVKILHIYILSFIKTTCGDKRFKKFLSQCFAKKLESVGVTSFRSENKHHCGNSVVHVASKDVNVNSSQSCKFDCEERMNELKEKFLKLKNNE